MKPGPELDALVATKVMKWEASCGGKYWTNEANTFWLHMDDWSPSTDIAMALEVVEKIFHVVNGQRSAFFALMQYADGWKVTFVNENGEVMPLAYGGRLCLAKAKTAPHAICLAALKAVA